jgi:Zn-dependent protease/CBS domain-containing protein
MMPMSGFPIGRIAGVEIRLNFGVLIIAMMILLSLATRTLPFLAPGDAPLWYWIVAALGAVVFVGSILWHEMAHVLVALRYRLPVLGVVLHLFGGVAQIGREPERPGHEFWIAIAGPLSSAFLFFFFGFLSNLLNGSIGALAWWLASVNLSLALFNLLPGFPLDGGRVLRAAIWRTTGSYLRATRLASRIGQGMAGLFAFAGVYLMFFGDGAFNGLWFLLIALFLYGAASTSLRISGRAPLNVAGTPVQRVMRTNVPLVDPSMRLAMLAWKYMDYAPDQAFPVLDNGVLVGMVTARETEKHSRLDFGKLSVRDVMLPRDKVVTVRMYDDLQQALSALDAAQADHAIVFDDEGMVGTLNRRDIVYRT